MKITFSCLRVLCFVSVLMFAFVSGAHASKDQGVYVGGGLHLVDVGISDPFENSVNFICGDISLGYKYNNYVGVEVRYGRSLRDEVLAVEDEATGLPEPVNSKLNSYFSAYYRAELANEIAKVYVLIGQTDMTTVIDYEDRDLHIELSESGLSYGLGFGLWLDERMNLNFEFKTLVETDIQSFTAGSITADYRF